MEFEFLCSLLESSSSSLLHLERALIKGLFGIGFEGLSFLSPFSGMLLLMFD